MILMSFAYKEMVGFKSVFIRNVKKRTYHVLPDYYQEKTPPNFQQLSG